MKFEIYEYDELPKKEETVVRLTLEQRNSEEVALVAVNEAGDRIDQGSLLSVHSDGCVVFHDYINKSFGFPGRALRQKHT